MAEAKTTGVVETEEETTGVAGTEAGRVTGLVEKPDGPASTLATTGCYVLPEEVFHACRLLRPSARGEYELADAVNLLVAAGANVQAVQLEGWRVSANEPEDVDRAERRP